MNFGTNLSGVEGRRFGPAKAKPEPGDYKMRVVSVKQQKSRNGNDMLVFGLDIDDGSQFDGYFRERPLLYFQVVTENSLPAVKALLDDFVKSNDGVLSEEDINGSEFDEQRLVGLSIGCNIGYRDKWLNAQDLFDVNEVANEIGGSSDQTDPFA